MSQGPLDSLLAVLTASPDENVTLGRLVEGLGDQAHLLLMLLLTLPNAIPGPPLPGFSAALGLPVAWLAWQLARGRHQVRLPDVIARRALPRARLAALLERARPTVARLERMIRPRVPALIEGPGRPIAALMCLLLALVMSIPIPLGNLPAALPILVLALALLRRDGLAALVGHLAGVTAIAWNISLIELGIIAARAIAD